MKRKVLWITVVSAAVFACGPLAAPIVLSPANVGSGNATVTACDGDGLTHGYGTSRGNLTAVTIGGLADPACEGGSVRATVTNAAGDSIASAGPQPIPSDGDVLDNSVTISTSLQPAASQVAGIHIVVEGP